MELFSCINNSPFDHSKHILGSRSLVTAVFCEMYLTLLEFFTKVSMILIYIYIYIRAGTDEFFFVRLIV